MDGVAMASRNDDDQKVVVEEEEEEVMSNNKAVNNNNLMMMMMRRRRRGLSSSVTIGNLDLVLRVMGMVFTLVAAMVAGLDRETRLVPITLITGLPPLRISATAKWHYLSSSVYFVVINAIACAYSAASLILSLRSGAGTITAARSTTTLGLIISDVIMVALLFSANGAAAAVGILGLHGNSHVQWRRVCNVFKKFCRNGAASITISMLASFTFLLLVIFATSNLHKRSK